MTKSELLAEYTKALKEKGMARIDGISSNSTKASIENAINCLKCSDTRLEELSVIFKTEYPSSFRAMPGDFKTHYFNRLYVYNTALNILQYKSKS